MGEVVKFGSKKRNKEVLEYLSHFDIPKIDKMIWDNIEHKVEFEDLKNMGFWARVLLWPYKKGKRKRWH